MSLFIKLIKELKAVKLSFSLGMILLLVSTAGNQFAPLLVKQMIDNYLSPASKGLGVSYHSFQNRLLIYLAIIISTAILRYVSFRTLVHASNNIISNLRNRAFDIMQRLPISYFDHRPAGKIATRIVNDTETLRNQFFDNLLSQIIICLVQIIFIYIVMIYLDFKSGLALLMVLPIFYGIQVLYQKMTDKAMTNFYNARSAINTQVNETMNGVSIIQLYHNEDAILEEFQENIEKMKEADKQIIFTDSIASWTLTEFIKYTIISGILAFIGYQFLEGHASVTVGKLFIYINYLTRLFDLLGSLVRQLPNIQRSRATGERLMALLEEKVEEDSQK